MGVFTRMMEGLASKGSEQKTIMIDATYLKAHRTASSLRAKKAGPDDQPIAQQIMPMPSQQPPQETMTCSPTSA